MSSLTQAEIRVLTKMVQILRQEHKQVFQYSDPDLAVKVGRAVEQLSDPILSALWQSLPETTKAQAKASSGGGRKTRMYRGQVVEAEAEEVASVEVVESANESVEMSSNEALAESKEDGRWIVYRGQKQWVPNA